MVIRDKRCFLLVIAYSMSYLRSFVLPDHFSRKWMLTEQNVLRLLQIKEIGWSPAIRKLAGEINLILREIYRRRTKENIRLTFDIFAIRCLSLVLNTTFNEGK